MRQKALYTILRTLDSTENGLKGFARYALPTKVKRNEPLQRLVAYIMRHRKTLTIDTLDLPTVFSAVYSDEPYSERKIGDLYNRLAKKITEYFVQLGLEGNNHLKILLRAAGLRSVGFDLDAIRVLEQNLDVLPEEEAEHYLTLADYHEKLFERPEKNKKDRAKRTKHLAISIVAREKGQTIKKLKHCCAILERKLILGEEIPAEVQAIIDQVNQHIPYQEEVPLIRVFAHTFFFLQGPSVEGYFNLKAEFIRLLDDLKSEHRNILTSLMNGLNMIHLEDRLPEYFSLFRLGITQGFLFYNGQISLRDFSNAVISACELGEVVWAEQFMSKFIPLLKEPDETLVNTQYLLKCFLHFGHKEYSEALEILPKVKIDDYSYGIHRHALLIRCTYEIGKHEAIDDLLSKMNSFQVYLNYKVGQKLLSNRLKVKNINFLIVLRRIIKSPFNNTTKEVLYTHYEDFEGNLVYGRWLKSKIDEL